MKSPKFVNLLLSMYTFRNQKSQICDLFVPNHWKWQSYFCKCLQCCIFSIEKSKKLLLFLQFQVKTCKSKKELLLQRLLPTTMQQKQRKQTRMISNRFCSKKKLGCQWKGKLAGDFEQPVFQLLSLSPLLMSPPGLGHLRTGAQSL